LRIEATLGKKRSSTKGKNLEKKENEKGGAATEKKRTHKTKRALCQDQKQDRTSWKAVGRGVQGEESSGDDDAIEDKCDGGGKHGMKKLPFRLVPKIRS